VNAVDRILVALDHSPGSDDIVEYACAVARGLGASITLLHAYEPPNAMVGMVAGATIAGEAELEHEAGMALLDRAAAIVRAHGLAANDRTLERSGPASQVITRHARTGKFGLVVLGTHGRSRVSRVVRDSVADHVVRDVSCPVLLVHLPRR
jgi:nucleotide-binding universal stress UspA family protein